MKFKKEFLQELLWGETDAEIIENKIAYTSRWSVNYKLIFKVGGKYYEVGYSRGATESQDEQPFEYAPEDIDCEEVEPYEATVVKYRRVGE